MNLSSLRHLSTASLLVFATSLANGQQSTATLPDAPGVLVASSQPSADVSSASEAAAFSSSANTPEPQNPAGQNSTAPVHEDGQTKRILGIIPNFRAVSANQHLPPQSIKEKFVTASQDSFDYSSIVVPALLAGYNQAKNSTPEFHQGGAGYGRYLWHSFVDQTTENYFVEFIVPAIAHEDTRYYTLGTGGFKKRAFYAVKHVVICRDDAGKDTFNSGEIVGAALSSALSNAYYPSPERTFGNTASQYGLDVGIDAFTFVFKEFWPDINHKLFHAEKDMTY